MFWSWTGTDLRNPHFSLRQQAGANAISDDPKGEISMNVTRLLGLAAVGALLILAAPAQRAQAMSLVSPGAAAAIQDDSKQATTEVRWGHRHRWYHRHHWRHHRRW